MMNKLVNLELDTKVRTHEINRNHVCFILAVFSLLAQGCTGHFNVLDRIDSSITLYSTECNSIDWSAIHDDYNKEMLSIVNIELDNEVISVLGFRPTIVYSYVNKDIDVVGIVLNVGSCSRTGLYLFKNRRGTYLIEAGSSLPLEYDYYLTQWELHSLFTRSEEICTPVSRGIVYVEQRFWREICGKITFPKCFEPVMLASMILDKETRFRSLKSSNIETGSLLPASK